MSTRIMSGKLQRAAGAMLLGLATLVAAPVLQADDTEIYTLAPASTTIGGADTNILFMLDNSGSMQWCMKSDKNGNRDTSCNSNSNSRIFALRKAMDQVLEKLSPETKVGLVAYGSRNQSNVGCGAGTLLAPMLPLNTKLAYGGTQKEFLLDWFVDASKTGDDRYKSSNTPANWYYNYNGPESTTQPICNTPLFTAYAETASYLMGKPSSYWGQTQLAKNGNIWRYLGNNQWANRSVGVSSMDANGVYKSIVPATTTAKCTTPSWHIILLTDGEPTESAGVELFNNVLPAAYRTHKDLPSSLKCDTSKFDNDNDADYGAACARQTARFLMNDKDYRASTANWKCKSSPNGGSCSQGTPPVTVCNASTAGQDKLGGSYTVPASTKTYTDTYRCARFGPKYARYYDWVCDTPGDGKSCANTSGSVPSSCSKSEWEDGDILKKTYTATVPAKTLQNTYTCNYVKGYDVQYDNGLRVNTTEQVPVHTHGIFLGADACAKALNADGTCPDYVDGAQRLKDVADAGSGLFVQANDVNTLLKGFSAILKQVTADSGTISAPGVAVNQMNRFLHLDQLYYAVFKPSTKKSWSGNLKRYWLEYDPITKVDIVADAQGKPAVNTSTKFFETTATSCWGQDSGGKQLAGCTGRTLDGADVLKGGAVAGLAAQDINDRKVFVSLDPVAAPAASATVGTALTPLTLPFDSNKADRFGITISGGDTTAYDALIAWVLGRDSATPAGFNQWMGDPLHSQPAVVNYGFVGDNLSGASRQAARLAAQEDGALQKNYVFVGTNSGYLHALDTVSGSEKFAFIPYELLGQLKEVKDAADWTTGESRTYGLDAPWTVWRRDGNGDGAISTSASSDDWVYLYGGMRMGGSTLYALDMTDLAAPSLKWTIQGALDGGFQNIAGTISGKKRAVLPANGSPYRFMGQSWAQPVLARIAWGTTPKLDSNGNPVKDSNGNNVLVDKARTVLIFGGGYDPVAENTGKYGAHNYGHQLYIVDAKTGALLYWASGKNGVDGAVSEATPTLTVSNMTYGITGSAVPVDRDSDGFTDMIYYADLGGQLWRMDLRNKTTGASNNCSGDTACGSLVYGVNRLASLGEASNGANITNQRRFFEGPTVALMQNPNTKAISMVVGLASGNRAHPRTDGANTAQDRIYYIVDATALDASLASPTVTLIKDSNLVDVTSHNYATAPTMPSGYRIDLDKTAGEKAFSTPIIFQGKMYLTTYVPDNSTTVTAGNECKVATGKSRLYGFSAFDGRPVTTSGNVTTDRYTDNVTDSITGDPQILFRKGGGTTIVTGTNATKGEDLVGKGVRRTRWYEKSKQ